MAVEFSDQLLLGERVDLLQKNDRGGGVFSLLSFSAKFVTDFPGADQGALGLSNFGIGDDILEVLDRKSVV